MDAQQLKEKYFQFFQEKGHTIIPSASLIPSNDPSVLFTTAGMQPLVPFLLGQKHPSGKRLVNLQKCLRTVDFESIGDNTHHTFFQMLGNWSIGDYFKKESITWSFEFLTSSKWLNLPLEQLAFTVYQGDNQVPCDEESAKIWKSLGVVKERIAYLGEENFWSAGETGPCGPSTEIFYWCGEKGAPRRYNPNDQNWVEIWNNVFMAYNRESNGQLVSLKQKNVDTGMGFERTLAVLSGKKSAYETDLFLPVIKEIEKLSGRKYDSEQKSMRIIADHLRAAVFLIGDPSGIVPSNVGQGYILRRLIRRSARLMKQLGTNSFFTVSLAKIIVNIYSGLYPELEENSRKIFSELEKEEQNFAKTLESGLKKFEQLSGKKISGQDAFLLFQSYGFPIEMTEELAKEKGIAVDVVGFKEEYEKHQQLSRVGAEKQFKGGLSDASLETVKLHTASHLLGEALRRIVSYSIKQKGSNITPERLRFDFNFERKLTEDELKKIEAEVNLKIRERLEVVREEMPLKKALEKGAQGEFGARYPEKVSVYTIGNNFSKEICLGPHTKNTSELGRFKIVKEESVAAGVRRIKAVLQKS